MKSSEILELLRAGYTKSEIDEMFREATPEETDSKPEQKTDPEKPEESETDVKGAEDNEKILKLEQEIKNLRALVQKQNIDNSGEDTPPPMTAADALASLIKK